MEGLGMRRWWALGALALSVLVVGLDLTVLSLALPTLATDLHASTSQLQWIVDAYSLVLAAMLLPAGLLGDRFGRKRLLLVALVLFGLASATCAYAGSAGALIAARAALGLGGAFLIPLSMAVLTVLFAPDERPKAIAVWVAANAVSWPIGPILGGWLLNNYWWGSVFLINVPVVALALVAVAMLLPESRSAERPRLDVGGVLVSSAGLAGVTYGAIEAGQKGWGDARAVLPLVAGALVLLAFVYLQRRASRRPAGQPLVDLSLFRSAGFTWGTALTTVVSFALFGLLFALPQYFQTVRGTDALGSGVRLLPLIGGLLVGAQAAERVGRRAGTKVTVAFGFALMAAALGAGATTSLGTGYGFTLTWVALLGAGLGFAMPTAMNAALGALSVERSGVGSGLIQAIRQVGGTIGVAVLGSVLNAAYHSRLALAGLPARAATAVRDSAAGGVAVAHQLGSAPLEGMVRGAFVHGMDVLLVVCSALALLGVALALAFLPRGARAATVAPGGAVPAPSGPTSTPPAAPGDEEVVISS